MCDAVVDEDGGRRDAIGDEDGGRRDTVAAVVAVEVAAGLDVGCWMLKDGLWTLLLLLPLLVLLLMMLPLPLLQS